MVRLLRLRGKLGTLARLENGEDDPANESTYELGQGSIDVEDAEVDAAQLSCRGVVRVAAC